MAFTEDLTPFFDVDNGFSVVAIWKGLVNVNVIFDNAYLEQFEVSGRKPFATGIESDFSGVQQGETLVIGGVTYTIDNFEPDGTGEIVLELKKAS